MVLQAAHSRANELGLGENTTGSGDAEPTSCGLGASKMHVSMGGMVHLYLIDLHSKLGNVMLVVHEILWSFVVFTWMCDKILLVLTWMRDKRELM